MASNHRTTVYLSPQIYRALKVKAATTDRGFSELVNEAIQLTLKEDLLDEEAFRRRRKKPGRVFSEVLRELKSAGLL